VPRLMDFRQDLTLPAEAIAQIADDARNARGDRFGVRQIELYHNPQGQGVLPAGRTKRTSQPPTSRGVALATLSI
jgi:hypothetical protein